MDGKKDKGKIAYLPTYHTHFFYNFSIKSGGHTSYLRFGFG
jgi:hypothetical protein